MTAKEYMINYILVDPSNLNSNGNPHFKNLTEFFDEVGGEYIFKEELGDSRWWSNLFCVQKFGERWIGYVWAETTGDDSAYEKGWTFNEDSVCFVEPIEVVTKSFKKIS